MSAWRSHSIISAPSANTLPDGHLQFVVFRRDLMNSAPERVTVRVVARVARALTFDKTGKAKTVDVDGSWAVRPGQGVVTCERPDWPVFLVPLWQGGK